MNSLGKAFSCCFAASFSTLTWAFTPNGEGWHESRAEEAERLEQKVKLPLIRVKGLSAPADQQWGGEGENPSHTEDTRASRNPCPHINNPGVHLFKPENFWTSWISSRPHSLGQVPKTWDTWDKRPVRKCHRYAFCWKLLEITQLQTPLEHGIQKPRQALCCSHFHPSCSGLALWGGIVGIPVFCYNWPHLLAHCLCMLCSSQKLALN